MAIPRRDETAASGQEGVEVVLVGGPPDWHGTRMRVPDAGRGVMLASAYAPSRIAGLGPPPRAVYDPDPAPLFSLVAVWWFRGWSPASAQPAERDRLPCLAEREEVTP
ncbi:hypothetical protein J0910_30335 [Nocardiopsis sp. CNT-189]|uniref:hypothetical protein n=1 Tax=Nocardiopsis oceanisediminis TaxID=2816862 RepID=UPI003B2ABAFA